MPRRLMCFWTDGGANLLDLNCHKMRELFRRISLAAVDQKVADGSFSFSALLAYTSIDQHFGMRPVHAC
jgi:hypothetical protein